MAYPSTSSNDDRPDWEEIQRYWLARKTEEPVSEDLKRLVREDLIKAWHFSRVQEFFFYRKREWTTIDSQKITLGTEFSRLDTEALQGICNNPTAFYWLQSAQMIGASGELNVDPPIIFATIYEERSRCKEPDIEFGHFLANPIRILPNGPSTVSAVVEAHDRLCVHASDFVDNNNVEASPCYRLQPLYHAIIVLLDQLVPPNQREVDKTSGLISLRRYAQQQSVLLVRTGREEGLITPFPLIASSPKHCH